MNYYIITDTHFNHQNLVDWTERPANFEKQILSGLKELPHNSTLIHLGDVCIGNDEAVHQRLTEIRDMLNLNLVLVRGNHDKKSGHWYIDHGWNFVCDSLQVNYMGEHILFSHRPKQKNNSGHTINVHGHTHGNNHREDEHIAWYNPKYNIDVCPELVGYKPLRLDSLIKSVIKNK